MTATATTARNTDGHSNHLSGNAEVSIKDVNSTSVPVSTWMGDRLRAVNDLKTDALTGIPTE